MTRLPVPSADAGGDIPDHGAWSDDPPAEGEAPLDPGWGGIEIDFAAIDALAAEPDSANDPAFEWKESPKGRKWRSIELLIRTDLPVCGDLRVRVRNH